MLYLAVCDDEPEIARHLSGLASACLYGRGEPFRICLFHSGEALLKSAVPFDIVLLDIKMDGMSGMEAARILRKRRPECALVFVTGLEEYVYDAFEVDAINYLLKPVKQEKLDRTLEKILTRRNQAGLVIKQGQFQKRIAREEILYCESLGHKVSIYTATGCESCYDRLENLERDLPAFFRCHRGYLVNLEQVVSLGEGYAVVSSGERVPIAARRRTAFRQALLLCKRKGGFP